MENKQDGVDREGDGGFRVSFRIISIEGNQNERISVEKKKRVG